MKKIMLPVLLFVIVPNLGHLITMSSRSSNLSSSVVHNVGTNISLIGFILFFIYFFTFAFVAFIQPENRFLRGVFRPINFIVYLFGPSLFFLLFMAPYYDNIT